MTKVCTKTAAWIFVLMLIVPGPVLLAEDPPSAQKHAVREAQPVATTPVPPALHHALAKPLAEAASFGAKAIPTPPTGSWGIVSEGDGGGGIFRDSDSEAEVWLGSAGYGVQGFGSVGGGYFKDSDSTGLARVGYGNYGIYAYGSTAGGYFTGPGNNGNAYLGHGSIGISAFGLDKGVEAYGTEMGGYFGDLDGTGYAEVGRGNTGISASGTTNGGVFSDDDDSGYAYVGVGDRGIEAFGNGAGGYFQDWNSSGYAYVGYGSVGIWAHGSDAGVEAHSSVAEGKGIEAYGYGMGGYFEDPDSSAWAMVAISTSKIGGPGSVSFVQNHPYDRDSVIVYAAPEGDEVATYTRGTARLVEGEATVPLGATFKWVTNPDIGLTAFLTPVSEWCDLYVVEQSTDSIVVRSRDGSDCGFNYMVYGLRIGFEESSIVQEKKQESYIPSMADHRQLYERRPDLKTYNSLERFKDMHHAMNPKAKFDLSSANALRDAIIEFDPAVHGLPGPKGLEEMPADDLELNESQREAVQGGDRVRATRADQERRRLAPGRSAVSATIPVDDEGNVYATSFRPSSQDLASLVDISEEVQPGDVLVIDADRRGLMRRGSRAADNGVVGIVADTPGVVPDSEFEIGETEASEEREQPPNYQLKAPVAFSGVVDCKVDASFGAVWTGDLLVTSPTPGHAMAQLAPLPGTVLGKALEPLEKGVGTIKVLVMLR